VPVAVQSSRPLAAPRNERAPCHANEQNLGPAIHPGGAVNRGKVVSGASSRTPGPAMLRDKDRRNTVNAGWVGFRGPAPAAAAVDVEKEGRPVVARRRKSLCGHNFAWPGTTSMKSL
jgi:hypothetical protein